jgi:hypothetical protein
VVGFLQTSSQNYMTDHVCGTGTLFSVPPPSLGELRQHVLKPLMGNSLFSEAEHLRANHFAYECEDVARLIRWGESVQVEIARREATARAEAAYLRRQCALRNMLRQIHPTSFRCRCYCLRRPTPAPLASFPSLNLADRRAGTFDRAAAAHFQPADSLTFASLLNRPAK